MVTNEIEEQEDINQGIYWSDTCLVLNHVGRRRTSHLWSKDVESLTGGM
jgi:hypothetical protein